MGGVDLSEPTAELLFFSMEKYEMVKKDIDSPAKFANSECIHSKQKLWMRKIDS